MGLVSLSEAARRGCLKRAFSVSYTATCRGEAALPVPHVAHDTRFALLFGQPDNILGGQ
jgi:hypothetical protein